MNKVAIYPSIVIFLLFSFLLISCNDNMVSSGNQPKIITSLSGYINDFNSQNNHIVQARIFHDTFSLIMGIDTVGIDRLLNLQLHEPEGPMLEPISEIASNYGSGLTVSDLNAKGTGFLTISVSVEPPLIGFGGTLLRRNNIPNTIGVGISDVRFAYADRDVNISGTVIQIMSIIGPPPDTSKYNVNINMGKGWNVISYTITDIRAHFIEYNILSDEPTGTEWYYSSF